MVEFLCVRRREKRSRPYFYWGIVKVFIGSIQCGGFETFWDRKLSDFFGQHVSKYLKQFSIKDYT